MNLWVALRMFLWMTLLTGVIYPLLITAIAQLAMKQKADGDLVLLAEKPIGAVLIGQKFESDKYFWGRPSATAYSALPSGGSNLGPTSVQLKNAVEARKAKNLKTSNQEKVPSELLFASGSGLDPHISVSTALFQIDRILKVRGLNEAKDKERLQALIVEMTERPVFGFFGHSIVNVLLLNMSLDEQFKMNHSN